RSSRASMASCFCCVVIGLLGCGGDAGALREGNDRARALTRQAEAGDAEAHRAAAALLDSLAEAYPARERLVFHPEEATERDSLVARVLAKRAFLGWLAVPDSGEAGRAEALHAALLEYVEAAPASVALRDSVRAEFLRSGARVVGYAIEEALASGDSARADQLRPIAVDFLDVAERVARNVGGAGMNALAAHINRCRAAVLDGANGRYPCAEPERPGGA